MPRRRINIGKLYQLRDQLSDLEHAREKRQVTREIMFDTFHRQHWQDAVDRAWFRYHRRHRSTTQELVVTRRPLRAVS